MSVARCREINARLRAAGITVHEWPGWESRGNGQTSAFEGALVHHTATPFGGAFQALATGRPDLAGPLCNYAGNDDGSLTVVAAHPANHAGASGGRSMGPLPTTTLFNKRVLGLEIVYPGIVPMRDAQYRSATVWSRIATDVVGHSDISRARAHAETSITGKFDPADAPGRTINMAAFRAAALINSEDPMDAAQYAQVSAQLGDIQLRVASMHAGQYLPWPSPPGAPGGDLRWFGEQAKAALAPLQAMLAAVVANQADDLSAPDVLASVDAQMGAMRAGLAEQQRVALEKLRVDTVSAVAAELERIRDALAQDDIAQAKATVDELFERLRPAA